MQDSSRRKTDRGKGDSMTEEERRERNRQYARETRQFRREHGICTNCGHEKAFYGKRLCPSCLEKEAERTRGRKKTDEQKAREKERYYEHKLNGICVRCKRPATKGSIYCVEHRIKDRTASREWARKNRNKGYAVNGLCVRCGAEPEYGRSMCLDCLEKQRKNMEFARGFIPRQLRMESF